MIFDEKAYLFANYNSWQILVLIVCLFAKIYIKIFF